MMATPRLKDKYVKEIVPALKQRFSYKSIMQVPKIEKICINKGMGVAVTDKKLVDVALEEISTIRHYPCASCGWDLTRSSNDIPARCCCRFSV